MTKYFFPALLTLLLTACDSTFFGDAEPSFPSPFADGEVTPLEPAELTDLQDATASQRHPGIMYATETVTGTTQVVAFDEDGTAQGQFTLEGIERDGWKDLAIRDQQILLLQVAGNVGSVHRYDEPRNPSPFTGSTPLIDSLTFTLSDAADVSTCMALGAAKSQNAADIWLLCGARFYRLNPVFGSETTQIAQSEGRLELLLEIGEVRDFSISPGGQYALLVGSDLALIAQADDEENPAWADKLSNKSTQVAWNDDFAAPMAGTFAFNTVLLYLYAPAQPQGQLFAIFTP